MRTVGKHKLPKLDFLRRIACGEDVRPPVGSEPWEISVYVRMIRSARRDGYVMTPPNQAPISTVKGRKLVRQWVDAQALGFKSK